MNRKGVCYDTGRIVDGRSWRPEVDPAEARRELAIIRDDLHCNAVRIRGRHRPGDLRRRRCPGTGNGGLAVAGRVGPTMPDATRYTYRVAWSWCVSRQRFTVTLSAKLPNNM